MDDVIGIIMLVMAMGFLFFCIVHDSSGPGGIINLNNDQEIVQEQAEVYGPFQQQEINEYKFDPNRSNPFEKK